MVLTSVRPGDIVEIDHKGRIFLAFVNQKERHGVMLKPITPGINYYSASAREVKKHWARRGNNGG